MKKETVQKVKKGCLNVLSVVLMGVVLLPMILFATDLLAVMLSVIHAPILGILVAAFIYTMGSVVAYAISKRFFNFIKDKVIIKQKYTKKEVEGLCDRIEYIKRQEVPSPQDIDKAEELISKINPIEKIDETIDLLNSMKKGKGMGFLFAKEDEDDIIKLVLEFQRLKEKYTGKIEEFEEIKRNARETVANNQREDAGSSHGEQRERDDSTTSIEREDHDARDMGNEGRDSGGWDGHGDENGGRGKDDRDGEDRGM